MQGKTSSLGRVLRRFARDQRGATSIEYAIVASGIALAVVAAVYGVRNALVENYYNKLSDSFTP